MVFNTLQKKSRQRSQRGFTLLELLISVSILAMLMLVTSEVFTRSYGSFQMTKKIQSSVSDTQFLMNLLAKELRTSTVVSPSSEGSTTSIKFFEYSKAECIQYRFNSSTQRLEIARSSAGSSFSSCNNSSDLSGFSSVGTGALTGSFYSVPSRTVSSGSPRVGRVTMTVVVEPQGLSQINLQTTASLRDYGYIGLQ